MATVQIDDDTVLWSASEADRAGRPLLLLLHGFNSNEGDLFGLSPYLPLEPAIASLRAPSFTGYGYAWFPLLAQGHEQALAAAAASTEAIIGWLERVAPEPLDGRAARLLAGRCHGDRAHAARPRAIRVRGEPVGLRDARRPRRRPAPGAGRSAGVLGPRHRRRSHRRGIHLAHDRVAADARRPRPAHLRGPRALDLRGRAERCGGVHHEAPRRARRGHRRPSSATASRSRPRPPRRPRRRPTRDHALRAPCRAR